MGNVCVHSDGSVRILVHHFSRACEDHRRWDLWSSDLLLRTDNGLLAPAKRITTFRSSAQSSQQFSTGGRPLTMFVQSMVLGRPSSLRSRRFPALRARAQ